MASDSVEVVRAAYAQLEYLEAVCARVLAGDKEKKMLIAGLTRAIVHAQSAKRLLAMLASGQAANAKTDAAPPSPSAAQPSQDVAGTSGESLAGLSKEGSETP